MGSENFGTRQLKSKLQKLVCWWICVLYFYFVSDICEVQECLFEFFLFLNLEMILLKTSNLKASSFALLISRYILRFGQAAQEQQRPCCPNPKMYLEIRRADERLFSCKRQICVLITFVLVLRDLKTLPQNINFVRFSY